MSHASSVILRTVCRATVRKADYSELGHRRAFDISNTKSALESELGRKVRQGALKAD